MLRTRERPALLAVAWLRMAVFALQRFLDSSPEFLQDDRVHPDLLVDDGIGPDLIQNGILDFGLLLLIQLPVGVFFENVFQEHRNPLCFREF
jgi:hypothetical protein